MKTRAGLMLALALLPPLPANAQVSTTLNSSMPALQADKDPNAPDAIWCRPPQQLPASHLMGPKICKTNSFWAELHDRGLDLSPDGQNTLPSEKYRTTHDVSSRAAPRPAN